MKVFLSHKNTTTIKAILMFLIIVGHNHIISPEGGLVFGFVYSFHIYGFFILPFLYDKKIEFNITSVFNQIIRNWIPYLFFFLLCYGIYHFIVLKDSINFLDLISALLNGSATETKETAGFVFLWFMPAYAAMSIVKIIFDNSTVYIKGLIILICIALNIKQAFTFNTIFSTVPFGISQGFYYFGFGLITKFLLDRIPKFKYLGAIVFIVVSTLYWLRLLQTIPYVFAISGFLFLFSIADLLSKIPLLHIIGKYSFPIYLAHVIVYNTLEVIFPKTFVFGFVNLVLTIVISLGLSYLMTEISIIRKLVLPRNWQELKTFYKKQVVIHEK